MTALFVYSREGQIKVLDLNKAKDHDIRLRKDGWKHTCTIAPDVFIKSLYDRKIINDSLELIVEPKQNP